MSGHALAVVGSGVVLVLVVFSAFFSSSETAIFTASAESIEEGTASGDRRASTLAEIRADSHRLLVTILVGNNVVNVAISSITTVVLVSYLPAGQAVTLATVLASAVVLVFGEIVPKSYGLANADGWALTVAVPLTVVERLLFPVVVAFDVATRRLSRLIGGDQEIEQQYSH